MDIFEEIKEAVMIATPGEDTRNYYRNQGVASERSRIIKLLEENSFADWLEIRLDKLVELINGETNA
jgi:hypothetical protein